VEKWTEDLELQLRHLATSTLTSATVLLYVHR